MPYFSPLNYKNVHSFHFLSDGISVPSILSFRSCSAAGKQAQTVRENTATGKSERDRSEALRRQIQGQIIAFSAWFYSGFHIKYKDKNKRDPAEKRKE